LGNAELGFCQLLGLMAATQKVSSVKYYKQGRKRREKRKMFARYINE
jgi:hypothetical protein